MARRSRSDPQSPNFKAVTGVVASAEEALGQLTERARRLEALRNRLLPLIPEDLRQHCELANYRDATLVFIATTPVWAARLRRTSPEILHSVHTELKIPVCELVVRVSPPESAPAAPAARRSLSERARSSLQAAAAACPDPQLKAAMEKAVPPKKR